MTFKKVILIGLIVVMLESIAGYVYLTYRNKPQPENPKPVAKMVEKSIPVEGAKASLTLKSGQASVKKGQNLKVDVMLNTFSSNTSAADLTIKYDPISLSLIATDSAKPFQDSRIYQKTVFNSLNTKGGLATMSAVSENGQFFRGNDLLTTLTFKALKVGPTEITIVFTPGETRDTNIVSDAKDILESVQNLSLNILP